MNITIYKVTVNGYQEFYYTDKEHAIDVAKGLKQLADNDVAKGWATEDTSHVTVSEHTLIND